VRLHHLIDDAVNLTWVRVWNAKTPWPRAKQRFRRWLLKIHRRECHGLRRREDALMRGGPEGAVHPDGVEGGWNGVANEVGDFATRRAESDSLVEVQQALHRLPERYRRVLVARYWRNETLERMAARRRISVPTACRLVQAALEMLRARLRHVTSMCAEA
jgi:RNA polymerase sigma factor (sigma-70 family)